MLTPENEREFLAFKKYYTVRILRSLASGKNEIFPRFGPNYGYVREILDICDDWADNFPIDAFNTKQKV